MTQLRIVVAGMAAIMGSAINAQAVSSGELYTSQSYLYGRFEARVQFAPGDGVVSSFFLWKDGSETSGTFWNELDFEKVGADCHLQTNAIYGNPSAQHTGTSAVASNFCTAFHTYAYEWTPEYIAWLIDGTEIRRETGATVLAFSENASAGMQMRINTWPGNASFGGNFSASILPVHQYINWVQYSSYAAGVFSLEWREDFAQDSLPSDWLTGNWGSAMNLSTHSPDNVGLVGGYAVVSLTADDATGFAGGAPADVTVVSKGGATSAGGTMSAGGATFGISAVAGNPNVSGASATSNTAVSKHDGGCDCALVRRRLDNVSGLMGLFGVLLGAVWRRRVACRPKT